MGLTINAREPQFFASVYHMSQIDFFMANQYIVKVKNSFCKYLNENKNICGIADAKVFETKEEANAFIKNSKDYEILKKYNN